MHKPMQAPQWPYSPLKYFILCPLRPRFLSHSCHTEGQKQVKIGPFPKIMSVIDYLQKQRETGSFEPE